MVDDLPDLLDPAALERRAAGGSLGELIDAWAARLAGSIVEEDRLRRVVLAALRVDLAVIVREPALLFSCVYDRVYWHGSAEAAAFHDRGIDEGAPHPAAVTGVAVGHDGSLVVTGARDEQLRCWDAAGGRLRGARALTDDDHVTRQRDNPDEYTRVWRAEPEAVARLVGWLGFRRAAHARTSRRHDGLTEIVEGDRVVARVVTHHDLEADPTGTRWARRVEHIGVVDDG